MQSDETFSALGSSGVSTLERYVSGSFMNVDRKLCRHFRIRTRYFDEWTNSNTEGQNSAAKCNSRSGNRSGTKPTMSIATSVGTMNKQSARQEGCKRRKTFAGYDNDRRWTATESGKVRFSLYNMLYISSP